jgi:hypothetical protein
MNNTPTLLSSRNQAVQTAYYAMLKQARQLLSTIEGEEFRHSLVRAEKRRKPGLIHEFVNPLLYLRLTWHDDGSYSIHYGFEPCETYESITRPFVRSVYKLSMKDSTSSNIEDRIRTDWFIHNPDDMYEYIDERRKYHCFKLIKYRPSASKRKQMRVMA